MPETSDQLDKETELLCSMCAHLPIGLNRHLNMMACLLTYNARSSSDIESGEIWRYFHTKYHQDRLNDLHNIPFPNDEMDFDLYECEEFKELIDKRRKDESAKSETQADKNKDGPSIEASDDNTLSGASTPVNITPQFPTRKRKSTAASSSSAADTSGVTEKSQTITPSRRRDRSDSEKTESKHSQRHRSDKDNKDDKTDKSHHVSSKDNSSSTKRVRNVPKRPVRNSPATMTNSSSTPRSSSSSSNRKHDKKHK